jgi:hypothetical protein
MKSWTVLFLLLLVAAIAWGLARDLFSRQQDTLTGIVASIDAGAKPKRYAPSQPRYRVHLADGARRRRDDQCVERAGRRRN